MSTANKKENVLSPVEEKLVKELVTEGREKGFVTIDEINENLGDETPSAEQLEKIFEILRCRCGYNSKYFSLCDNKTHLVFLIAS